MDSCVQCGHDIGSGDILGMTCINCIIYNDDKLEQDLLDNAKSSSPFSILIDRKGNEVDL